MCEQKVHIQTAVATLQPQMQTATEDTLDQNITHVADGARAPVVGRDGVDGVGVDSDSR